MLLCRIVWPFDTASCGFEGGGDAVEVEAARRSVNPRGEGAGRLRRERLSGIHFTSFHMKQNYLIVTMSCGSCEIVKARFRELIVE